jgi:hypothetical protein
MSRASRTCVRGCQIAGARLGAMNKGAVAKLREREKDLHRKEQEVENLVRFIARGDDSAAVRTALKDVEAEVRRERADLVALREESLEPVRLPDVEAIAERALDVERMVAEDPTTAREELGHWFDGGPHYADAAQVGSLRRDREAAAPDDVLRDQGRARWGAQPSCYILSCAGRI